MVQMISPRLPDGARPRHRVAKRALLKELQYLQVAFKMIRTCFKQAKGKTGKGTIVPACAVAFSCLTSKLFFKRPCQDVDDEDVNGVTDVEQVACHNAELFLSSQWSISSVWKLRLFPARGQASLRAQFKICLATIRAFDLLGVLYSIQPIA